MNTGDTVRAPIASRRIRESGRESWRRNRLLDQPAGKDSRTAQILWDPDAAAHRTVLRGVVVVDVLLAGWYFQWLLNVHRASNPLLYVTLVLAEMFNLALASMLLVDRVAGSATPTRESWMEDVSVES